MMKNVVHGVVMVASKQKMNARLLVEMGVAVRLEGLVRMVVEGEEGKEMIDLVDV